MQNIIKGLSKVLNFIKNIMSVIFPLAFLRTLGFIYGYCQPKSKSFSQKGEDLILKTYFDNFQNSSGYYLDVGCFHPTWISNTQLFHKNGWAGTAVDIDEFKLNSMKLVRGSRVKTICGAIGTVDAPTESSVYKFKRIWSDIDTLDFETAKSYENSGRGDFSTHLVKTFDINSILENCPHVNLINIDVEGIDHLIVRQINFDKYLPDAILFEDNNNWGGDEETKKHLTKYGYELLFISGGSVCFAQPPKRKL